MDVMDACGDQHAEHCARVRYQRIVHYLNTMGSTFNADDMTVASTTIAYA